MIVFALGREASLSLSPRVGGFQGAINGCDVVENLNSSGRVTAGPTRTAAALSARLLPVERPFRLVCPKYSATRHQRKMYG